MASKKLDAYFNEIPVLQHIDLERLGALQKCYAETVSPDLAAASRVGTLEGHALVIMALNGPVAAKLKQQIPSVLEKIKQQYQQVTSIRVIVQGNMSHNRLPGPKRISVSPKALKSLGELEYTLSDSPLKTALQRLLAKQSKS